MCRTQLVDNGTYLVKPSCSYGRVDAKTVATLTKSHQDSCPNRSENLAVSFRKQRINLGLTVQGCCSEPAEGNVRQGDPNPTSPE